MEKSNIQLETIQSFQLTLPELQAMYVRMALCRFKYLRDPNYNEILLLTKLTEEFKKLSGELNKLAGENSTNFTLHKAAAFFDSHYKNLLAIKANTKD